MLFGTFIYSDNEADDGRGWVVESCVESSSVDEPTKQAIVTKHCVSIHSWCNGQELFLLADEQEAQACQGEYRGRQRSALQSHCA